MGVRNPVSAARPQGSRPSKRYLSAALGRYTVSVAPRADGFLAAFDDGELGSAPRFVAISTAALAALVAAARPVEVVEEWATPFWARANDS